MASESNPPEGAVSVVNPQGTEETGTDRPAAPIYHTPQRMGWCGYMGEIPQ
jgi:hypothetical protein